jgi:hypothetical protein
MLEAGLGSNGKPKFTFHALRHFTASTWLAGGMRLDAVKVHIGHAKVQTTIDKYGHLLPDDQHAREAVRRLTAMFPGLTAAQPSEVDQAPPTAPAIIMPPPAAPMLKAPTAPPPEQTPISAAALFAVGDQVVDAQGKVFGLTVLETAPAWLREAVELIRGGWSVSDMCAHIGRHPAAIASTFRRFGMPKPIELVRAVREQRFASLADAGYLDIDIAERCGCHEKTVWAWRALRENKQQPKLLKKKGKTRPSIRANARKQRERQLKLL